MIVLKLIEGVKVFQEDYFKVSCVYINRNSIHKYTMYPSNTHFIRYQKQYLGNKNYVFGFIKQGHAEKVVENLKYASPIIQISPTGFVVNRPPPLKLRNKYLIKKQRLTVQTLDPGLGYFFTSVNNISLKLIDDVVIDTNTQTMVLQSHYEMDEVIPIDSLDIADQLERLYISNGKNINYASTMSNIILDRFIDVESEDDEYF